MISHLVRIGAPVLAVLAIAGCGSSSSTTTTSTTPTTTAASTGTVAAIAAKVPAAVKSKGTLVVGTEAQYAPNEFLASDGHTIIGMDPDLVTALAETMGLKAKFNDAQFEAIIPGIQAGRYDLGASSFTDTKEREKKVDFVTYYNAGISFYAKTGTNPGVESLKDTLRQDGGRREGNRRAGRIRSPEQGLHQRRQEGRDGPELPGSERT